MNIIYCVYGFFLLPIDGFRHNNLSRIVFPENAQEIHSDAFGDNALTELVFEGVATIIHRHAFNGAKDMAHVTLKAVDTDNLRGLLGHHA
ncbi:hypothetical protein ACFQ4N_11895 [Oceanobacillus iheyensis]|uniref:hypothetical protein n=1 Tax=Oceanobacillus iheyensis TaxID=182710 RepID=UPI00362EB52E